MTAMLCPLCAERVNRVVDPGCPACLGVGALGLGAWQGQPPVVVAGVVRRYLAEFGSTFLDAGGQHAWRSVDIAASALEELGLLEHRPGSATVGEHQPDAPPGTRATVDAYVEQYARELGALPVTTPDDELAARRAQR